MASDVPAPPASDSLLPSIAVTVEDGSDEVTSLMESMSVPGMPSMEDMLAAAKAESATAAQRDTPSPFVTRQTAATISGVHTDLIVQSFADRIFVTVTQTNKIGTMVSEHMCFHNLDCTWSHYQDIVTDLFYV